MSHTKENSNKSERIKTILKKGDHVKICIRTGDHFVFRTVDFKRGIITYK